ERPDFLAATREVREGDWRVAAAPADLRDRRCEITGPVDRKMMINALNSGARVFMGDFEDSLSPTWQNVVDGQQNVRDAVRRAARARRRAAGVGEPLRLRPRNAPQRGRAARARQRAVLLPAEAREPS